MNRYLFIFGFETPRQSRNNALRGWDDEDSEAVFIGAPSKDAALDWGRQVAERFITEMFQDSSASWGEFAHWIEADAGTIEKSVSAGTPWWNTDNSRIFVRGWSGIRVKPMRQFS